MRDKIQFSGRVEGGKVVPSIDRWVEAELGKIESEQVFITLEPIRNRRSLKQNAYYWGVVLPAISAYNGDTPEELHEHFKAMFLSVQHFLVNDKGEIVDEKTITMSTTRLKVMAFSEYIEKIVAWAGEFLHVQVPEATHELE